MTDQERAQVDELSPTAFHYRIKALEDYRTRTETALEGFRAELQKLRSELTEERENMLKAFQTVVDQGFSKCQEMQRLRREAGEQQKKEVQQPSALTIVWKALGALGVGAGAGFGGVVVLMLAKLLGNGGALEWLLR